MFLFAGCFVGLVGVVCWVWYWLPLFLLVVFVSCGVDCVGLCAVAGFLWVVAGVVFSVFSLFCGVF